MDSRPEPLLFHIRETTYLGAFVYAAMTSAITAAVVLEYRMADPFLTYVSPDEDNKRRLQHDEEGVVIRHRRPRVTDVLQTCAVSFVATMLALVMLHICFAVGESLVVK